MWRLPTPEFKVLLYGPGLTAAGVRARAHFEAGVLVVQGKGHWYTVQAERIALKTGGFDGRQWLVSWYSPTGPVSAMLQGEDTVDLFIKVAPKEIAGELRRARKALTSRERNFKLGMGVLSILVLVPFFLLCVFWVYSDDLSKWAADQISVERKVSLGDMAYAQLRPSLKLVEQGAANDAVQRVGVRLTAGGDIFRYRFHLADDPRVNAFALPGGHVVVYTGLLRATKSAEELAGVMAHEVGHVELRHTLRNMIHALGWRAVLSIALGDFAGGVWGGMARELGDLSYSRDMEREADMEGVRILRRTGVPADGMLRFYERMAEDGKSPPALFSTHPTGLERMTALRAAIAGQDNYPSQSLDIDWARVQAELPGESPRTSKR